MFYNDIDTWLGHLNITFCQPIHLQNVFFLYLKSLDQNKDVVHTDSQYQERYDLNDDESGGYPTVAEETQGRGDGQQYDQHTGQT